MLIYDKREGSNYIDFYNMSLNAEKARDFRKGAIECASKDNMFYSLKTNDISVVSRFDKDMVSEYSSLNFNDGTLWSKLTKVKYKPRLHKKLLEYYIEGYIWSKPMLVHDNWHELCYLYMTEESSIGIDVHVINNMINLPRNLYLLHLLQLGKFEELTKVNIEGQLGVFDLEYLKSVNKNDFTNDGTELKKVEIGTRILRQIRK